MRTTKEVQAKVQELECVTCDRCGCVTSHEKDPHIISGVTITMSAGYGSGFDMIGTLTWDLCDDCWDKIHQTFKNEGTFHSSAGWS